MVKGDDKPAATVVQEPGPAEPSVIAQKVGEITKYQRPFNSVLPADFVTEDDTLLTVGGLRTVMSQGSNPDSFDARVTTSDGRTQAQVGALPQADNKEITDHKATFMKLVELVAQTWPRIRQV
ncbi:MAG TPA: hypothetical protein VF821_17840 [Lentzea sp.]